MLVRVLLKRFIKVQSYCEKQLPGVLQKVID